MREGPSPIAILRLAYSGERAAGFAYRGHGHSVRRPGEREAIAKIEADEWHHRRLVGGMLASLGARPSRGREARAWIVGRTLGLLCHVAGWLLPGRKRVVPYSIQWLLRAKPEWFRSDLVRLFELLRQVTRGDNAFQCKRRQALQDARTHFAA